MESKWIIVVLPNSWTFSSHMTKKLSSRIKFFWFINRIYIEFKWFVSHGTCNSNKEQIVAFCHYRASLFLANYIIENSKIVNRRKRSKTNHENQQLLMMLLQHQKLVNISLLKIILLSSCQKALLRSFFKYSFFYRVFIISFPNTLFVLQNVNIRFWNNTSF